MAKKNSSASLQQQLRRLPAVDKLICGGVCAEALRKYPRPIVIEAVRNVVAEKRRMILEASAGAGDTAVSSEEILRAVERLLQPPLRRVINATGVVVHTNLGRSPLSIQASARLSDIASGYSNLEFDLESGRRGKRTDLIRELLLTLTGAEDALVVNNNAAAVYLALRVLAGGREVIVSRGELVEIGGSFRMPEVMSAAGAKLIEVGTTNKTRPDDYRRAIGPQTALLLKVHRSNFELVGFGQEVEVPKLALLAHQHGLPLLVDMGWATLLEKWPVHLGPPYHPRRLLEQGADVVCFSGDKLLGGPQSGILLGRADYIKALASDPMARALRVGKLTLAALWSTLSAYREGGDRAREIPTVGMLLAEPREIQESARRLKSRLRRLLPALELGLEKCRGRAGGGALPRRDLPGWAVTLGHPGISIQRLANRLRRGAPPVLCRTRKGKIWLDVRTVLVGEVEELLRAVVEAVNEEISPSPK